MVMQMEKDSKKKWGQKNSFDKEASFRDRIDTVKQLIDPAYLLEQLGFKIDSESSKEIRCACLVHGGDNTTSFRVNKELNTWVCFSSQCHQQYGNDFFGLIMAINKCNFMSALEYLEELTGSKNVNKESLIRFKHKREQQEFMQRTLSYSERPSIVDEAKLKYYKPYRSSFFTQEGFTDEVLDYFEIAGGYSDVDGVIRDIIPIRDDKKNLVAYSLRDIRRDCVNNDRKYKLTPGFDKDTCLYNLNNAKLLSEHKPIIIVEGFKSVWRLHSIGVDNVVACMGAGITSGQANLLCTYANKGVVLFYDNDYAGASAVERSAPLLEGKMKIYLEVITEVDDKGKGLDPADLDKEQLMYYVKDYM